MILRFFPIGKMAESRVDLILFAAGGVREGTGWFFLLRPIGPRTGPFVLACGQCP